MSTNMLRYQVELLIEAVSPLKIGTGDSGVNVDELIALDANGLPFIPGTSICGVLRHSLAENESLNAQIVDDIFGYQKGANGAGSRLIVSEARMVGEQGEVMDGFQIIDSKSAFYSRLHNLGLRDHCRINHKGTAEKTGKFDSQVLYKGARFVFRLELIGEADDAENWQLILHTISSPLFRIGGGTRKGFGEIKVLAMSQNIYDLHKPEELQAYLECPVRLSVRPFSEASSTVDVHKAIATGTSSTYALNLKADDFFKFSSGHGDEACDSTPKREHTIEWDAAGTPFFSEQQILIPATSVKGALAHRTAYYYNQLTEKFADKEADLASLVGENNPAVRMLFGHPKNENENGRRGKVLVGDVFLSKTEEKLINHVALDRFTGGALQGALFDEKVTRCDETISLHITVENSAWADEPQIKTALEKAMQDITTGMLPLGGSVMRGHGCFSGTLTCNGEAL